ncbi:MAG: hypothetical protein V4510_08820 [bacterium]
MTIRSSAAVQVTYLPPTAIRCGVGLDRLDGPAAWARGSYAEVTHGGTAELQTSFGSAMLFIDDQATNPQDAELRFFNSTMHVESATVVFQQSSREVGLVGIEYGDWLAYPAENGPILLLADSFWPRMDVKVYDFRHNGFLSEPRPPYSLSRG